MLKFTLNAGRTSPNHWPSPLLEAPGRDREAAVHCISAASCYLKAGELSRAVNLYHAALGGPLLEESHRQVQQMLAHCLARLSRSGTDTAPPRRGGKVPTGV